MTDRDFYQVTEPDGPAMTRRQAMAHVVDVLRMLQPTADEVMAMLQRYLTERKPRP